MFWILILIAALLTAAVFCGAQVYYWNAMSKAIDDAR